jgi:hypothetical protein
MTMSPTSEILGPFESLILSTTPSNSDVKPDGSAAPRSLILYKLLHAIELSIASGNEQETKGLYEEYKKNMDDFMGDNVVGESLNDPF